MSQTTKLILQQIRAKREQKAQRAKRLKLWLSISTLLSLLVILPVALLLGSAGFLVWGQLQAVPNYPLAVAHYQSANVVNPPRFFSRTDTGETVPILNPETEAEAETESMGWTEIDGISSSALNGVFAQWPELFLNQQPAEPLTLARWQNILLSDRARRVTPASQVATFILGAEPSTSVIDQAERNLLQNQIETAWSPQELAGWHLNVSSYGNGVIGLEQAARFYFGRNASQLTLPEAAMLVGIPTNPAVNPLDNPAKAKLQQEAVLEAMLRQNLISQEQFVAARFTPLEINTAQFAGQTNVILDRYLHSELSDPFDPLAISTGGLNVVTTLDAALQQETDCLARFYLAYVSGQGLNGDGGCATGSELTRSPRFPNGQFNSADSVLITVLDPQTGQILALSGEGAIAQNPTGPPLQPAGERQAGSGFYPFIYLTALSQGHNLSSMVLDISLSETETPQGAGPIFLQDALNSGSPAGAADVLGWVGRGSVFNTASELGASPTASVNGYVPGQEDIMIGVLEMAAAYGVLANQGVRTGIEPFGQTQRPYIIGQVENQRGDILYEAADALGAEQPILPSELVWLLNQQLAQDTLPNGQLVAQVSGTGLNNQDEWTIGYSPNLLVAVWAGNLKGDGVRPAGERPITPALWETVMGLASADRPVTNWPAPQNIVTLNVCWPSGLQPNGLCPTRQGLFIAGTEPVQFDRMYQSFLINSENGNLATNSTPSNLVSSITVQLFPPEAQRWAELNGFPAPPTTYDPISTNTSAERFQVTAPEPFEQVSGATTIEIDLDELGEFERFRVAAFQGLSPGQLEVLVDDIEPRSGRRSVVVPLTLPFEQPGLYTLLITGFRPDGSIDEVAIPISLDPLE